MTWSSLAWRIGLLFRMHRRHLSLAWRMWRRRRAKPRVVWGCAAPKGTFQAFDAAPGAPIRVPSPRDLSRDFDQFLEAQIGDSRRDAMVAQGMYRYGGYRTGMQLLSTFEGQASGGVITDTEIRGVTFTNCVFAGPDPYRVEKALREAKMQKLQEQRAKIMAQNCGYYDLS